MKSGLNFVVGRNGTGKTLFLRFMAGHSKLNPVLDYFYKVHVDVEITEAAFGLPKSRKELGSIGLSAGEPFRWITENTIEEGLYAITRIPRSNGDAIFSR